MLEHDELDSLLNGIDWDQLLSPLDLNLPTDPDIITLLSSSSPISPVALPHQPSNPLVDKILQSLTNTPIQSTDHTANSRQGSRVNILLLSLFGSKAYSNKNQSEEPQSNPFSPRRLRSNSTALATTTQDARASLSRPNRFQRKQQIFKQQRREKYFRHWNSVKKPRYNPHLHYQLSKVFSSWEIVFWDHKRQEYTIQNTVLSSHCGTPVSYRSTARRLTLNPHAPIFKPTTCSRLFTIYRPDLLTRMEASTSQDVIDLTIPTKCPKTSPDSNSPTVSEQLHLLTTQVNQLKIHSEQALERTKPPIQTFSLANIKQVQYLHAVRHQVAQFFVDLNTEKSERLKLRTTFRQLEDELTLLRRQVSEPSSFSLPVPFTVNPPCSAASQDPSALANIQTSRPRMTISLKRTSSTTSRSRLTESPKAPASTQTTSGPSLDLETRFRQFEEEFNKARDSRETIAFICRSQFAFLHDRIRALESGGTGTILWKLTSLKFVFDTAKSSARLAMLPKTSVLNIIAQCTAHTLTAITSLFSSTHTVWTLPWKSRFNYVRLISRRLRWFNDVVVPQNDSTLSPRSTRPPKYVDFCLRTLRKIIHSKA